MKIVSLKNQGHPILGDLELDFALQNGEIASSIIFAGENGAGKSTILELIQDFFNGNCYSNCLYEIILDDEEINAIRNREFSNEVNPTRFDRGVLNNHFIVKDNFVTYLNLAGEQERTSEVWSELCVFTNSIYFDIDENKDWDRTKKENGDNVRIVFELDYEIENYLTELHKKDIFDYYSWSRKNVGSIISEEVMNSRLIQLKKIILENIEYIEDVIITFTDSDLSDCSLIAKIRGKDIPLNKLSTGEKSVLLRTVYLLSKKSNNLSVFVDEPEYSLHPNWQEKIIKIYNEVLFWESNRTGQMFISTHSPFVVHNIGLKDLVFVLRKNDNGLTEVVDSPSYLNYSYEDVVKNAFNMDLFSSIDSMKTDNVIVTEGKTDWMHIKNAFDQLLLNGDIENIPFRFLEYDSSTEMGDITLLRFCQELRKIDREGKIITIFDRDNPVIMKKIGTEPIKDWGNNVFSFLIPIPDHRSKEQLISIEHYYSDDLIKTEYDSRRLFMANEFDEFGIDDSRQYTCRKQSKCGKEKITVMDSSDEIVLISDKTNKALSKNEFVEHLISRKAGFENCSYDQFKKIYDCILSIIDVKHS